VAVDLGYASADPPGVLYHGTATRLSFARNRSSIEFADIKVQSDRSTSELLSTDRQTIVERSRCVMANRLCWQIDGAPHGIPVDGHRSIIRNTDVWLTEHVAKRQYAEDVLTFRVAKKSLRSRLATVARAGGTSIRMIA
jgi:RNA:NAD 2'-phosphotransferase (TPT1/KptA family)